VSKHRPVAAVYDRRICPLVKTSAVVDRYRDNEIEQEKIRKAAPALSIVSPHPTTSLRLDRFSMRAVTIIGLLQTCTVFVGFIAMSFILKYLGWGINSPDITFQFSPLATFLRRCSLWMLFVPLWWTLFACWVETRSESAFLQNNIHRIGILLLLLLVLAYFTACWMPGYQPSIYFSKPAS
jgi:hypothetical protein